MATESTVNEKQEKREGKEEKQSSTNHGCGCCKFCKVIISGKKPVKLFHECNKYTPYLCVFGCLNCNVPICRKCTKQEHNKHKICDLFELDEKTTAGIQGQRLLETNFTTATNLLDTKQKIKQRFFTLWLTKCCKKL